MKVRTFVRDQQRSERDERKARREAEREQRENEKAKREHGLEIKRLTDIEAEKKREHEKHLAELEHKEQLRKLEIDREKEEKAHELNATLELSEATIRKEKTEYQLKIDLMEAQDRYHVTPVVERTLSARIPKLPYFDEDKDDMDAYLQRFERYARSQGLQETDWATHLSALLKGKALEVYSRIPAEQALEYNVLKEALLKRFEMTDEWFRKRFRSCRPEVGETFAQFAGRLARYLDRWMDLSNTKKTYHDLFDLLIREQFIQSCNRELTLFLKERVPKNIEEMTTYADQYREARGGSNTNLIYKP